MRSTPTGQLTTDADLFRAVSLGLPGTMMPPWRYLLQERDRWAVALYVKSFSSRFAEAGAVREIIGFLESLAEPLPVPLAGASRQPINGQTPRGSCLR